MFYNVKYLDRTGGSLVFNDDIELERDYSDDEELLMQVFKQEIVKRLRNIPQKSDITIIDWSKRNRKF